MKILNLIAFYLKFFTEENPESSKKQLWNPESVSWNPESKYLESRIQQKFWNPKRKILCNPDSRIFDQISHMFNQADRGRESQGLESGIQCFGIRNPALGTRNPLVLWILLHGAKRSWYSHSDTTKTPFGRRKNDQQCISVLDYTYFLVLRIRSKRVV